MILVLYKGLVRHVRATVNLAWLWQRCAPNDSRGLSSAGVVPIKPTLARIMS